VEPGCSSAADVERLLHSYYTKAGLVFLVKTADRKRERKVSERERERERERPQASAKQVGSYLGLQRRGKIYNDEVKSSEA